MDWLKGMLAGGFALSSAVYIGVFTAEGGRTGDWQPLPQPWLLFVILAGLLFALGYLSVQFAWWPSLRRARREELNARIWQAAINTRDRLRRRS